MCKGMPPPFKLILNIQFYVSYTHQSFCDSKALAVFLVVASGKATHVCQGSAFPDALCIDIPLLALPTDVWAKTR